MRRELPYTLIMFFLGILIARIIISFYCSEHHGSAAHASTYFTQPPQSGAERRCKACRCVQIKAGHIGKCTEYRLRAVIARIKKFSRPLRVTYISQNVPFQLPIYLLLIGRASHNTIFEIFSALADTQFPGLSLHSLADSDFRIKLFQKPFFFQSAQCIRERAVAGTAAVVIFYDI